jgi:hypothetical protein
MTQQLAEVLLLLPAAHCTGFLLFIAGVIQKVMNDMDEAEFQRFLNLLSKHAMRSPYAISSSTITFAGAFPYFRRYRLSNPWFAWGIVVYTLASVVSKSLNLPIYKRVAALDSSDAVRLGEERRKLQGANKVRAAIQSVSIVLMTIGLAKSPVRGDNNTV